MKKIYLFILLLCSTLVHAQTFTPPSFADVDNNYRNYVNNVFGALEPNRVPTGLLADYGFDFTDPKIYNGTVLADSTLMEQGIYSELYKTIFTSRFNNYTGTLRHPSIHDSLCYITRQKEVITLSGLFFKYNAIDPNAQANGKMQTVNGQLKDVFVNGVWQNPYQEFTTVAISPSVLTYKLTYCSVVLPSNLFLSNMLSQISSIQFDAGDGHGYRSLSFDVPLSLNYADTGWKHWVFKLNLTNGQQLYSHSKVHFNNTSNVAGSGGIAARGVADRRRTITATEQFNGGFGVADIVISFRNANDQVLRRPLIVAEGFDPGWITSPEEPEGESSFDAFINTVRFSNSAALRGLISNDPSAYDIVYVNWRNGTDWLQRNALVLEEVIRWVNQNKQNDLVTGLRNPNVVLGSSMGGVIARMALGRMDRNGGFGAHETNLYVSLDAPHQGANVPLGYQALARHATRMYISTGPIAVVTEIVQLIRNGPSPLLNLLLADQPASRQLLLNRIDLNYNLANVTNQQFLQELRTNWAYPANIRSIAISNGNECAIGQEFGPGSSLLYHYRSTKTRFIGDLIFMATGFGLNALGVTPLITIPLIIPGSNKFELTLDIKALANGGGNQVYYGNIKLTKKVLWLVPVSINIANKTYNAPSGLLPFDTYPGGFYTVTLANQPGAASQDWMFTYNNSFFIQRRFTFIPTTSALDIGGGNTNLTNAEYTARYIGAQPPAPPFQTPFQNFTTAFNMDGSPWIFANNTFQNLNNEPHERFFQRNANWLAAEMAINNPQPQVTNCSAFCTNGNITGNTTICNQQVLTAPFGAGVNYNWSVTDPQLLGLVASGNTVTVTRNGMASGNTTLTVVMTGACGNVSLSVPIVVGTPSPYLGGTFNDGGSGVNQPLESTYNEVYNTTVYITLSGTSNQFTWDGFYSSGNVYWYHPVNNNGLIINFGPPPTYYGDYVGFSIHSTNVCGTATEPLFFYYVGPSQYYRVAPNPVSSTFTVSQIDVKRQSTVKSSKKEINKDLLKVQIVDKMGNVVMERKFPTNTKSATIDATRLKSDIYTVRLFMQDKVELHKILVQH